MYVFHKKIGTAEVGCEIDFEFVVSRRLACRNASLYLVRDGEEGETIPMSWRGIKDGGDIYGVKLALSVKGLYWYKFFADHSSIGEDSSGNTVIGFSDYFQLTVYENKYGEADFLHGGIMYQIMVDRFFCEDRITSKPYAVYRTDWNGVPFYEADNKGIVPNIDFFGGNLKGIIKKLPYLKSLNVTCLYLNPIFEANSNHKYDTADYLKIDPLFGTEEDFKSLICEAEKQGISVILDGVFSHTGCDSLYFNMYGNYPSVGAYQSKDSPYYSWYRFRNHPNEYDSWWGIDILPNTNESDESFINFINGKDGVVEHWMKAGIKGWRLDVADELPGEFIAKITKKVKAMNPNGLVLGEVWEDASNKISYSERRKYFLGDELDSVTNYVFKGAILDFVMHGGADAFKNKIIRIVERYPKRVLNCLMNIIGTHDTSRVITVLSGVDPYSMSRKERSVFRLNETQKVQAIKRLKIAAVLQYTVPGVPCVYYGDEAGLEGFEDPFNRACFPWGRENTEILDFYKWLGMVRSSSPSLRTGDIDFLYAEGGICVFRRIFGESQLIVAVNTSEQEFNCDISDLTDSDKTFVDACTLDTTTNIYIPPEGFLILKSK